MANRTELLKDLRKDLSFEEDVIGKLSSFYLSLDWKEGLDKTEAEKIREGLVILKEESEKHARLIKQMVDYIESSEKNEF